MNNIEDSIKFMVEHEVENAILFLGILITHNCGQLSTKAYKKPKHMTRYLNLNSCHDFSQKVGLVKTLLFWANFKLITNYQDKTKVVLSICNALHDNDCNKIKKKLSIKK